MTYLTYMSALGEQNLIYVNCLQFELSHGEREHVWINFAWPERNNESMKGRGTELQRCLQRDQVQSVNFNGETSRLDWTL